MPILSKIEFGKLQIAEKDCPRETYFGGDWLMFTGGTIWLLTHGHPGNRSTFETIEEQTREPASHVRETKPKAAFSLALREATGLNG